jgi:hypothetical protein
VDANLGLVEIAKGPKPFCCSVEVFGSYVVDRRVWNVSMWTFYSFTRELSIYISIVKASKPMSTNVCSKRPLTFPDFILICQLIGEERVFLESITELLNLRISFGPERHISMMV